MSDVFEAEIVNGVGLRQTPNGDVAVFIAKPMSRYAYLDSGDVSELIETLESM